MGSGFSLLCDHELPTQHMPQSCFQFPCKLSPFFSFLLHTKVFTCFMWCCDYLCHCPAVWLGEATVCLHGNSVQGSVYCRCTLLRCKNAVNWCIVTGLQSWLFMLCHFSSFWNMYVFVLTSIVLPLYIFCKQMKIISLFKYLFKNTLMYTMVFIHCFMY